MNIMEGEKIGINRTDEVQDIVNALEATKADVITLVVPRHSVLGEEKAYFKELREAGSALGKELIIESIDDRVLSFAEKAGLRAENPLFAEGRRIVADVIVAPPRRGEARGKNIESNKKFSFFMRNQSTRKHEDKRKIYFVGGGVFVIGILALLLMTLFLPKATIALSMREFPWVYNDSITVSIDKAVIDAENAIIPGVIFSESKNITELFPASNRKFMERKATGKITIYNAYNTEPQVLVKTTRFETPEGKIYRIDNRVIVPGARMINGSLVPSSIETSIIADQVGREYNANFVPHLTIPGFQGSDKFEKFYGKIENPVIGGARGEVSYPTDADLKHAREEVTKKLEDVLRAALVISLPDGFKILDKAQSVEIQNITVRQETDEQGNFSATASGKISLFGFKEKDIEDLMTSLSKKTLGFDPEHRSFVIQYTDVAPRFTKNTMSLKVKYEGSLVKALDVNQFVDAIKGKKEGDLRAFLLSFSGIDNASVSFTPFWIKKIPKNPQKINITID